MKYTVIGRTTAFNYVYSYTDHLGNIRLRYTIDPEVDEKPYLRKTIITLLGLSIKGITMKTMFLTQELAVWLRLYR